MDRDSFRIGMRYLAAGVNVITTADADGARYGMTATAVCSVCAEPPTLLVCVNQRNTTLAPLRASGAFAVNVLGMKDRAVAERFSRPMEAREKFAVGDWCARLTGSPVLQSSLVTFECRVSRTLSVGTHEVIFGDIAAVHVLPVAHGPLLYGHGTYGALASVSVPESEILQMLQDGVQRAASPVSLEALLREDPEVRSDIDFAVDTGAISMNAADEQAQLDALDAQIVSLLGLARASGTIGEAGLGPEDYRVYVDAAEAVAEKEFARLEEAMERLDPTAIARHTHSGLEVANLLFSALHTRAVLRRVSKRFRGAPA